MKKRLLAPGPNSIPSEVLQAISRPIIHHRTKEFEELFFRCQEGLKWLFQSNTAPLVLSCSGTGAFEAAVVNAFSKPDKVLCVTGGKFGDNWFKLAKIYGLNAIEIPVKWGDCVTIEAVSQAISQHPDAKGLILVASETSTGVRNPFEEIGKLLSKKSDCLFVVDAVTGIGIFDISPEKHNIDITVCGSQKGMMLPPGLGFVHLSEKAKNNLQKSTLPKFYFDLTKEIKAQEKQQTAYTPSVSLIFGLEKSLELMQKEGLSDIFSRHKRLSLGSQAAVTALGLKLFTKNPSEAITSVYSPEGFADNIVYKQLQQSVNFTIAGGQEQFKGKIFRIGHMGYVDDLDLVSFFGALEMVLQKIGYEKFSKGASLQALHAHLLP